jgi:poly(beta-D-mannuronate) lyase
VAFASALFYHRTVLFSLMMKLCLLFFAVWLGCYSLLAKEIAVSDPLLLEELGRAAVPGDTLVLAAGVWGDVEMRLCANGTAEKPVRLKAAQAGRCRFTGRSTLRFSGQYVVVEGLWFDEPDAGLDHVIVFRTDSDHLAEHCTLRDCAVTAGMSGEVAKMAGGKEGGESRWCSIYGSSNTVERCEFTGKGGAGTTVVVWLEPGRNAGHRITGCYFGRRPNLGKNGGETLRIGDSKTNLLSAGCTVSGCLFEHCNGEAEIVSNKSCDNVYAGNTFLECEGALTLRHGHRCTVEQNWFLGGGKPKTGGVRVMGEGHEVRHNTFMDLTGDEFRAGLTLMLGDTRPNGYQQVRDVVVEQNTWVNCVHTVLIGMAHNDKCTLLPERVKMLRNVMLAPGAKLMELRCATPGWVWVDNALSAASVGMPLPMTDAALCKQDAAGLWRVPGSSKQGAQMKSLPLDYQAVGTLSWRR